jgi:hypothetical protein
MKSFLFTTTAHVDAAVLVDLHDPPFLCCLVALWSRQTRKGTSNFHSPSPVLTILTQVALYEHLASFGGGPLNALHFALYSTWASHHSWGMIITGNVQVSPSHLSLGRDILIPTHTFSRIYPPFLHPRHLHPQW